MRKRPVVAELERHYSRINDDLQTLREEIVAAGVSGPELEEKREGEIEQHREMLRHLTACLGLVEPNWKPPSFRRRSRRARSALDRGALLEMGYAAMWGEPRKAQTTRELLNWLWRHDMVTGAQAKDPEVIAALTNLLARAAAEKKIIRLRGQPASWALRVPEGQRLPGEPPVRAS